MKYLIPFALCVAPLCPYVELSSYAAVAVFVVGVVLALVAYGTVDTPFVFVQKTYIEGECCDGE